MELQYVLLLALAATVAAGPTWYDIEKPEKVVEQKATAWGDTVVSQDARLAESNIRAEFEAFKNSFDKEYAGTGEEEERYSKFAYNYAMVLRHNSEHERGLHTYRMGINPYSDMDIDEIRKTMMGVPTSADQIRNESSGEHTTTPPPPKADGNIPIHVDWRAHGCVTSVKQQGSCGSCATYGATGALEAQWHRATGFLPELSQQNLLDCTRNFGNQGCRGGWVYNHFNYIIAQQGIDTAACYPYTGTDTGGCAYNPNCRGAHMSTYWNLHRDEGMMAQTVAQYGPVSVTIDASNPSFSNYHSGVYYEPNCHPDRMTHVMLAVGYGTAGGVDYWIVKNSWGTGWGEQGYIRMARNHGNNCGICSVANIPFV